MPGESGQTPEVYEEKSSRDQQPLPPRSPKINVPLPSNAIIQREEIAKAKPVVIEEENPQPQP